MSERDACHSGPRSQSGGCTPSVPSFPFCQGWVFGRPALTVEMPEGMAELYNWERPRIPE